MCGCVCCVRAAPAASSQPHPHLSTSPSGCFARRPPSAVQLSMRVECRFIKDVLNGDDATEIRVNLKEVLAEGTNYRED